MGEGTRASISLGALIIIAWVAGDLFERIRLPRITGYVLTGLILGPHLLNVIMAPSVSALKFIDNIALALIGLHTGQELQISLLKKRFRSILTLTFSLLLFTVGGSFVFVYFTGKYFLPFMADASGSVLLVGAIIIAYLEGTKSPVSTIAILDETNSSGALSETTLGTVIFKDLIMALLLGVILAVCGNMIHLGEPGGILFSIFRFVTVSLSLGFIIGLVTGLCISFLRGGAYLVIIILALFITATSHALHLEVLLVGGAAGFIIRNFSRGSENFLQGLGYSTPFIYLLFFPVNAASLDLSLLGTLWKAALLILALRFILVFGGVWFWSKLGKDFPAMRRYGWMGFLNQESVTMALALTIAHGLPELGEPVKALMLTMVVISDLYAPAMFKYALYKSGEAGTRRTLAGKIFAKVKGSV